MRIAHDVPLAPLTTLGVGGPARRIIDIEYEGELDDALATDEPVLVLGGGSNLVIGDAGWPGVVVRLALRDVAIDGDVVTARAGVDWDAFVARMVADGRAGIECLSGIPGLVGATPMQNVGAYGQEVADTIVDVRAYDRDRGEVATIAAADCGFGYRTSRFRGSARWIIVAVRFRLPRADAAPVRYAELAHALAAPGMDRPSLATVRDTVRALRRRKGMVVDAADPDTRSAGSFFTNPIVAAAVAAALPATAPRWPQPTAASSSPRRGSSSRPGSRAAWRAAGSGSRPSTRSRSSPDPARPPRSCSRSPTRSATVFAHDSGSTSGWSPSSHDRPEQTQQSSLRREARRRRHGRPVRRARGVVEHRSRGARRVHRARLGRRRHRLEARLEPGNAARGRARRHRVERAARHARRGRRGAGLCACLGLPCTGSGILASALAMDKVMSKRIFESNKLPTPRWRLLPGATAATTADGSDAVTALADLALPCVVKPSCEGSSVGVTIVEDRAQIAAAVVLARRYHGPVLVEDYIAGTEVFVGVLDGRVLGSVEVRPATKFYDYEAKYHRTDTKYLLPPELPGEVVARAEAAALAAYTALGCSGHARADLRIATDGGVFVLEVNTLPGMTGTSLLPKIARAAGIDYAMLCEQILASAI